MLNKEEEDGRLKIEVCVYNDVVKGGGMTGMCLVLLTCLLIHLS